MRFLLGNKIEIGDQKDAGEFNIEFLARIEEGLQTDHEGLLSSLKASMDKSPNQDLNRRSALYQDDF